MRCRRLRLDGTAHRADAQRAHDKTRQYAENDGGETRRYQPCPASEKQACSDGEAAERQQHPSISEMISCRVKNILRGRRPSRRPGLRHCHKTSPSRLNVAIWPTCWNVNAVLAATCSGCCRFGVRLCRLGLGNDATDELGDLWRIPFGRADQSADFQALAVDQQCGGKSHHTQLARRFGGTVAVDRELLDTDLGEEFVNRIRAAIDRKRHHFEVGSSQRSVQSFKGWHLLAARHAPGRPNVEENDLAVEIRHAAESSPGIFKLEFGNWLWCLMHNELFALVLRCRD